VRGCDCKWLGLLGIASRERIANLRNPRFEIEILNGQVDNQVALAWHGDGAVRSWGSS
jgi:hypothetical protein